MSPILSSIAGLLGGAAAGLAMSAVPLQHARQALRDARARAARSATHR